MGLDDAVSMMLKSCVVVHLLAGNCVTVTTQVKIRHDLGDSLRTVQKVVDTTLMRL